MASCSLSIEVAYEILKKPSKPKADPWTTATSLFSSKDSTKSVSLVIFFPFLSFLPIRPLQLGNT